MIEGLDIHPRSTVEVDGMPYSLMRCDADGEKGCSSRVCVRAALRVNGWEARWPAR
jgi:hypothetical protein